MKQPAKLLPLVLAATLVGSASRGQVQAVSAAAPAAGEHARAERSPDELSAIELLRSLRSKDRPSDNELASKLSEHGERTFPLLFDVLVTRAIPGLDADDEPQQLSEGQEHVILMAVGYLEREPVLARVSAVLGARPTLEQRLAALACLGAVGRSNDLLQMFECALATGETALDIRLALGLRHAVTALLTHDALTFQQLTSLRRITRPELLQSLVGAVGDAGDARGLAYLSDVAYWSEGLIVEIMSQVRRLGLSGDEAVDDALRVRLRPYLDEAQPGPCRAAIPALVALQDVESIGSLIALLASESTGLRENAHWALRQLTGLALSPTKDTWARWHQAELAWLVRDKPKAFQRLRASEAADVSAALRDILTHPLAKKELVATLPDLLKNRWPAIRVLACRTLGELDAKESVQKLVWALEDHQPEVSQAAYTALKTLTRLDLPRDALAWQSATHTDPRGTEL